MTPNLHHAVAREGFGNQYRQKLAESGRFWKLSIAKFAPRCRARAVSTSKSLKTDGLGMFLEIFNGFRVVGAGIVTRCFKYAAGAGVREGCKKVGRRGGFEEGSRSTAFRVAGAGVSCCVMSTFANLGFRKDYIAGIIFAWQLEEFACLGWTFPRRISTCEAST